MQELSFVTSEDGCLLERSLLEKWQASHLQEACNDTAAVIELDNCGHGV